MTLGWASHVNRGRDGRCPDPQSDGLGRKYHRHMASGIRVKPLGSLRDLTYQADGSLFLVDVPRPGQWPSGRVHLLDRLTPSREVVALARNSEASYRLFRERFWRQLGTRSNVEQLARLRRLGKRSPGATLLTDEVPVEWSSAAAVSELLGAENQRPPDSGRYGYVYVVELEPGRGQSRPELYIGDTRESPEERFHKHITDYRKRRGGVRTSNADVRRRGKRLAYELFEHINPLAPEVDACERAKKLRLELEEELRDPWLF